MLVFHVYYKIILNIFYVSFLFGLGISSNYRLLMRSTHDHEDAVGQPIPDKVFMVMSGPKSKVYYCFIKLSGIFFTKIYIFIIFNICLLLVKQLYCNFHRTRWGKLSMAKIETPNTPQNVVCSLFTLRYTPVNAFSDNQRRAKQREIPDHLIMVNKAALLVHLTMWQNPVWSSIKLLCHLH